MSVEYRVTKVILDSLKFAEELMVMKNHMSDVDTNDLSEKFGTLSNDELLEQYRKDAEIELDEMIDLMESKANVPSEEIKFDINQK